MGTFYQHVLTLTHWGRVTHIYISELTIIGSDNGLSPGRHQAIIKWAGAGVRYMGLGLWQKIWIWGGGTRKKKEKKGAGVGRTKLGGNRRVETRG